MAENNTKGAKEEYEAEENAQRNVVKTQGNLRKNSLVPIAGQSEENLVNVQKTLMNPEKKPGKPGEGKIEDGISLEDALRRWRPYRQ